MHRVAAQLASNTGQGPAELNARIAELEATLAGILGGEVDALVLKGPQGNQVYTLKRADQGYRSMVEAMGEGAALVTADGLITYCNPALERLTGRPLVGSALTELFVDETDLSAAVTTAFGGKSCNRRLALRRVGADTLSVQLTLSRVDDANETGLCATITDLRDSDARYRMLFENMNDGVVVYQAVDGGADFVIREFNRAGERISGMRRDQVIGRRVSEVFRGVDQMGLLALFRRVWHSGVEELHHGGHYSDSQLELWVDNSVFKLPSGEVVAVFSDVTALKEHEQQLERLAYTDALTGLPNRILLEDRLRQAMAQAQRRGRFLATVYLDLDGFKPINDTYGHAVGDQFLIALSQRLRQELREGDTLARLGGDEFVIVLVDLHRIEASEPLLERLLKAATETLQLAEAALTVTASLGVTFFPQSEPIDGDQLLRQADQAMYQAKLDGKNCYRRFDREQDRKARGRQQQLGELRVALAESQFRLYYQPKINLRTGCVLGVEALIRWQHPRRGLLPPGDFLPLIAQDPLLADIDAWVLAAAFRQLDAWRGNSLDLPISVNVSSQILQEPDFLERLRALLAQYPGVAPSCLELEVLETSALENLALTSAVIKQCRTLGVSVALDDFGTGYSLLTHLKHLAVNRIKIDQSFVRDITDNPDDRAIINGVMGLATAFGRETIAEGVEIPEHGEILLQLGCEHGQGYAIARPMPAEAIPIWLARRRTKTE